MERDFESIGLIEALTAQQERIRGERDLLKKKIEQLARQERELVQQESEIQNRIHDVRARQLTIGLPTTASPSPKNFDFLRAWVALSDVLSAADAGTPVGRRVCTETIRRAVPGIPDNTIRSHLHRLKKRGFIEAVGSGWRLVQKGGVSSPVSRKRVP